MTQIERNIAIVRHDIMLQLGDVKKLRKRLDDLLRERDAIDMEEWEILHRAQNRFNPPNKSVRRRPLVTLTPMGDTVLKNGQWVDAHAREHPNDPHKVL